MSELIVLCNPGQAYKSQEENDVARRYTRMAIDEYDKFVSFDESYMPFVEIPDYETVVGKKQGKNLELTLFTKQTITRFGDAKGNFISSSYLFNPESESEDFFLPDLDVVLIDGNSQVMGAAKAVKEFYDSFGWRTFVLEEEISKRIEIASTSPRHKNPIQIILPETLREIAKEKVGYSLTDLCF